MFIEEAPISLKIKVCTGRNKQTQQRSNQACQGRQ